MKMLKNPLLILIFFALLLSACKSPVADEVPREAEVLEAPQLLDLLPAEATLIASYQIDTLQDLRHNSPLPTALMDFLIPNLAALPQLLGDERLDGLDEEGALYIALSREGFQNAIKEIRRSSPNILTSFDEDIPKELHLRIIAPALDAELLAQGIAESCEAQREYSCDAQVRGDFAVLDMALTVQEGPGRVQPAMTTTSSVQLSGAPVEFTAWDPTRPVTEGFTVEQTAAWKAFSEGDAPLALYGEMAGVFDQLMIFDLLSQIVEEGRLSPQSIMQYRAARQAQLSFTYAFESPELAESQDVAFLVSREGEALVLDALASLTAYGQRLVSRLAKGSSLQQRTLSDPVLDMRFGLDLAKAVEEAGRPKWATDIQDLTGATVEMAREMFLLKSWGLPLSALYSPITGYSLYNELVGPQTTPAEFAMIRGFWLQVYGMEDSDFSASPSVTSSLGLQLNAEAPVQSFEGFAQAALLPFGSPVTTKSVAKGEALEFQAASNQPVDELFSEEEVQIEPGLDMVADFKGIAALLNAPRVRPHVEQPILFGINFLANLGTSKLFAHSSFEEDQGLMRLQLGGEELIRPTAVQGGATPTAREATSLCVHQARIWSAGAMKALAENYQGPGEERARTLTPLIDSLNELSERCEDDAAEIQQLASDWARFREEN